MTGPSGTVTPNEEKSFSWSPSSQVPHFLRNHYRTSSNGHSTPGFPSSGNNSAASSVIHLPNSNSYSSGSTSEKTEPPSSFQTVPVLGAQAGNAQSTQPSSMAGTEDIRSKQAGKQKHSLAFGFFSLLSVILAAVVIAFGWINTPQQKLCLAFEDDFSGRTTLNTDNWEYEVRTDGFGNHEFSTLR